MSQLWDYLDDELTQERMGAIRRHLAECSRCHPHAEFAERFLEALGRCRCQEEMPEYVRERVLERLRDLGFIS
jgi:mycothiol system anti-sigma-R factor